MDATTASPAVTTTANNNNTNNELITTHNPTTNSHTNGSTSNNINNHNHNHNHNDSDVPAPPSSTAASTPAASTPPANSNVNANNNNDVDETLQHKYGLLKKRVREIEEDNDAIHIKLTKAMRQIKRLRVERIVLLEELDSSRQYRRERKAVAGGASDSEGSVSDTATTTTKDQGMLKAPATKRARGGKSKLSSKHHHNKHDVNGDAVAASSTPGPARKKRDPNAPKGPGNVFFLYCRLERDNIKDQLSSDNLGEATRLLGQKWKALSKDEKKVYYDMYNKELKEFEAAMELYNAGGGAAGANNASNNNNRTETTTAANSQKEEKEDDENVDMLQDEDDEDELPFDESKDTTPAPASSVAGGEDTVMTEADTDAASQDQQEGTPVSVPELSEPVDVKVPSSPRPTTTAAAAAATQDLNASAPPPATPDTTTTTTNDNNNNNNGTA